MADKLKINEIKEMLEHHEEITNTNILSMYQKDEPNIPEATVNWRIYNLIKKGVIHRIGRGQYKIGANY